MNQNEIANKINSQINEFPKCETVREFQNALCPLFVPPGMYTIDRFCIIYGIVLRHKELIKTNSNLCKGICSSVNRFLNEVNGQTMTIVHHLGIAYANEVIAYLDETQVTDETTVTDETPIIEI